MKRNGARDTAVVKTPSDTPDTMINRPLFPVRVPVAGVIYRNATPKLAATDSGRALAACARQQRIDK
jgi:hypothetical protein